MRGLGTIINVAAIVFAGLLGSLFKKGLKDEHQSAIITATGICVLFIGISGTLEKMITVSDGHLVVSGTMMMIVSFALGTLIGELLQIEQRVIRFGEWLKKKTGNEKDRSFVDAFVTTSLTVCIGAMAIVGGIQDGISGDYSILAAKSVLDGIILLVLTPSLGKGCIFSAIPVAILQGLATVLATIIQPILTDAALTNLSLVGSMMIFCVGINLLWKNKIRVANMLPTIIFAVAWSFIF